MKKTFLIAMGSGDPEPWVKSFKTLLPEFSIAKLGDDFEQESVAYAMTWYHPPGSLADFKSSGSDAGPEESRLSPQGPPWLTG